MVDNQGVEQMPSANLAVATHELARLPQTPEIFKIQALLKAAQAQVNDIQNWMWPPANWLDSEAISTFTKGLHHRQELCSKIYRKRFQPSANSSRLQTHTQTLKKLIGQRDQGLHSHITVDWETPSTT